MVHTMRQESIFGQLLQVVVPEHYIFTSLFFLLFLFLLFFLFLGFLLASPVVLKSIFRRLDIHRIDRDKVIAFDSEMSASVLVDDWWQFGLDGFPDGRVVIDQFILVDLDDEGLQIAFLFFWLLKPHAQQCLFML
jgi:hypothetical protein